MYGDGGDDMTRICVAYSSQTVSLVSEMSLSSFIMSTDKQDIIIKFRFGGGLNHISQLNPAYDAVKFPILFPWGEA